MHRVIIIGGGFGGLYAARSLRRTPVQITLIDRRNFHLFQPLLYQVATGGLSPANIASPLRSILRRQKNADVVLGEVGDIDLARRVVRLDGAADSKGDPPRELAYDSLIVATGSRQNYFGHPEWEQFAPSLKTIEDATQIRRRLLMAFERAERETNPERRIELLTFVIVGAGPTGVEMAGAMAEVAHHTMRHDFRHIDTAQARIILVDSGPRVLSTYPPKLSSRGAEGLERLGVIIRPNALVKDLTPDQVVLDCGGSMETIRTCNVIWAAGVQASPLGAKIAQQSGAELDRAGRIKVLPDCSIPKHPEAFVIGDLAHFACNCGTGFQLVQGGTGVPPVARPPENLPGVAPVAMQQGKYVADLITARLHGASLPPFEYKDKGSMATVGRSFAIVKLKRFAFSGFWAWVFWLFVHLMYIVEFENRLLIFLQWAWNYFTKNRAARLITGEDDRNTG
jgi:NADH dehydrogenase